MGLVFVILILVLFTMFKKAGEQEQLRRAHQEQKAQNTWVQTAQQMQKKVVRTTPAREQVRVGRMEANNTTILERAKANTDEDKEDVTLHTMEAEHNHSERVAPAVHHHPEDVLTENVLGTVEDLMVKGFDGNLCFERDFVGEAMDMINRFTVPSEI